MLTVKSSVVGFVVFGPIGFGDFNLCCHRMNVGRWISIQWLRFICVTVLGEFNLSEIFRFD